MTRSTLRERAVLLMERVMRKGQSLAQEYPLVFDDAFDGQVLAIEEGAHVRSACAVLTRDFIAGESRVRVGLIGSVSTDPDCRRRGFASRLLLLARNELARQGCALVLLWADDSPFYESRGFAQSGAELDFLLERRHTRLLPRMPGIRSMAGDDVPRMHRLYTRHKERVDRKLEESCALFSSPGMQTLVLEERNEIAAYSCLGRGMDLLGAVHEWAGAPEHVLALLRAHLERGSKRGEPGPLVLIAPTSAVTLRDLLRNRDVAESTGILGLARIGDPASAVEILGRCSAPGAHFSLDENCGQSQVSVRVQGPRGAAQLAEKDLLALLCPPRQDTSAIRALEASTGVIFPALPLPLFAWGLDSI